MSRLTVIEVLRRSSEWLAGRGCAQARLDAELLMAHVLGMERLALYVQFDRPLADAELDRVRSLVRERGRGVPVAYLLGHREFHSLDFAVDPRVLVPRPETEHLVEEALDFLRPLEAPRFADVGTGSGCIAVTLLVELPAARGHALDVSEGALEVAGANARRHGVAGRLRLAQGDLLVPLRGDPDAGRLDAVVSNPPYVCRDDPELAPEVRAHEPAVALFVPGEDPLAFARRIARDAWDALRPGGLLVIEVGCGSGPGAAALLAELGYEAPRLVRDLAGIERVALGRRPGGREGAGALSAPSSSPRAGS